MSFFDFTKDISAFSNPFGAPSSVEWNLVEGTFSRTTDPTKKVTFFYAKQNPTPSQKVSMDQATDGGGRRHAVYEYPYQDGQRIDDLGRKGETYTFNIKFFGPDYQTKLNQFIDVVVNTSDSGTLTHPVRGSLTVRLKDYEYIHKHDEWNSVSIRATFVEDNTGDLSQVNTQQGSQDSALRSALQILTNTQSAISASITQIGAALLVPAAIQNAMKQRLNSLTGQYSRLLGQLAATFSSDKQLQSIAAQSVSLSTGVAGLSSGTATSVTASGTQTAQLPAVYQVGFDATTQSSINSQINNYVNANQLTTQQAVFLANQIRQAITAAINEINFYFGNSGYLIVLNYRGLAVSVQNSTESCVASTTSVVTVYTTPRAMSLRMVAKLNGLNYDRQNELEALNPYVASVNLVPAGTVLTVPAA